MFSGLNRIDLIEIGGHISLVLAATILLNWKLKKSKRQWRPFLVTVYVAILGYFMYWSLGY